MLFNVTTIIFLSYLTFVINGQLILYNTDRIFLNNPLYFDCLNYYKYREVQAYQELSDVVDELIPYCIRPANDSNDELFDSNVIVDSSAHQLSFEQLRLRNITANELLSWSISMEITERYQVYLNEPNSLINEYIYNCTPPQFGLRCQYSFSFNGMMSFKQIVETNFRNRQPFTDLSSFRSIPMPCYILVECHRYGQLWCLDWREICDGNIDCFDEQTDEEFCFEMEMNECTDDEYRCHNGLCISEDLWEDGFGDTDCLDRSDLVTKPSYIFSCYQDPTFRCEEHACKRNTFSFPCGDGQCVSKFDRCANGRHLVLIDSMSIQSNLTDECWLAMICHTKLLNCNHTAMSVSLGKCDSLVQFPTIPIHSNHVSLFYENVDLQMNTSDFLEPDYICYDQQFCDAIQPEIFIGNLTCRYFVDLGDFSDLNENPWVHLLAMIEEDFRSCSLPMNNHILISNNSSSSSSSLYKCQNSSKLISKHRIKDEVYDCFHEDDENYADSCQLNDRYRIQCRQTSICWSPLVKHTACSNVNLHGARKIFFDNFCDGIEKYYYDNDGNEHSDEFGCQDWLCDNMYTRCDGFWTCADGRDESNCGQMTCPLKTFACLSPINYTSICLNSNLMNDGNFDCFGGLDEQGHCRATHPSRDSLHPLQCSNSLSCMQLSDLCDRKSVCPENDDEDPNICEHYRTECNSQRKTDVEQIFCGLQHIENHQVKYFSVYTSNEYPVLDRNHALDFNYWPEKHQLTSDEQIFSVEQNSWPWQCNRGLPVQISIKNVSSLTYACLCPPSYYGSQCQYQNQRIGLTLKLSSTNRYATYDIISMLIADETEQQQQQQQDIEAYDQFTYITKETCTIKLNRYLLFSTRPKNNTQNYSIHIDVYEKNALTYVGSWHFPIAFSFLPVNRLSISINLTNHILQYASSICPLTCYHGQCVKYINKNYGFCQCSTNWTGVQCNIPVDCHLCSSDSLCLGSSEHRPICICSLNKFGRRCHLTSTCPSDACQNRGQCVPVDKTIPEKNYTCLCSDRFFGQNCQYEKAKLDVAITDLIMPSYLVAYFFSLSNKSDPIETTILRKLTLFQHIVTFYIAIPYQLVFIQANHKYYLATLEHSSKTPISTSINRRQECLSTKQLLHPTILNRIAYERVIHFHYLCHTYHNLTCFVDENYLCLCTNDHHANCMEFNSKRTFFCRTNNFCMNDGQCLQDHPTCPSTTICLCPSCFFGNRCQFYAKGLGSTLDEILGYEFQRHRTLTKQPLTITLSAFITMFIFLLGLISSILTIIVFSRKESLEIGCGIYILASSITSLVTMILFALKFWFLFYSHQNLVNFQQISFGNCFVIEPLLKIFLYANGWLNACVAMDRTATAILGTSRDRRLSKIVAKLVTIMLFIIITCLFIPQLMHLQIFYDEAEERTWCVVTYKHWLIIYSTFWIFFHYFAPVLINIISIIYVLRIAIQKQARFNSQYTWWKNVRTQLRKHRHLLISSTTVVLLMLPHLFISIILDCRKSSNLLWFYLIGYFLSFLPAASVFLIFVLSSSFYRKLFRTLIDHFLRQIEIWKMNSLRL